MALRCRMWRTAHAVAARLSVDDMPRVETDSRGTVRRARISPTSLLILKCVISTQITLLRFHFMPTASSPWLIVPLAHHWNNALSSIRHSAACTGTHHGLIVRSGNHFRCRQLTKCDTGTQSKKDEGKGVMLWPALHRALNIFTAEFSRSQVVERNQVTSRDNGLHRPLPSFQLPCKLRRSSRPRCFVCRSTWTRIFKPACSRS
jgi:hypothetical protein